MKIIVVLSVILYSCLGLTKVTNPMIVPPIADDPLLNPNQEKTDKPTDGAIIQPDHTTPAKSMNHDPYRPSPNKKIKPKDKKKTIPLTPANPGIKEDAINEN